MLIAPVILVSQICDLTVVACFYAVILQTRQAFLDKPKVLVFTKYFKIPHCFPDSDVHDISGI